MFARVSPFACLFVMALFVQPLAAQPGAVNVESSRPDTSDTGVTVLQPGAEQELEQMEAARQAGESDKDGRRQAEEALRQAEQALANGKEPLPNERIGTAGGASRLTEAYWARQKQLEQNVTRARQRLNKI